MNESKELTHESFGQIRFSRVNGNANFYGSELKQNSYITMEVHNSSHQKSMSGDFYHEKGLPLIQVRMSSGQFAELITTMNQGSGSCCTIERLGIKKMENMPEQESRKEFVHKEFIERMQMFTSSLKEGKEKAAKLVKKKSLSKDDQHELNTLLNWLTMEVDQNIPFFVKQFQGVMDKVVLEAKTEVENAIQHKINVLGLAELHAKNKLIGEE